MMARCLLRLLWFLVFLPAVAPARADLLEYLQRTEPAYVWQERNREVREHGTVHDLHLVSQVWKGITWEHQLQVYVPNRIDTPHTMLLYIMGGNADESDIQFGLRLARATRAPCAILYHLPNQPLLDGKREDDLIAETFVQFLATGDEEWPLLFPMTKSVVKAMDALQAFAGTAVGAPVRTFVVSGASKRGWTSWLAAAADPRIAAVVPAVIDMLNLEKHMPHQLETWGAYSKQLEDYTRRNLPAQMETERGRRLFGMVDPYAYRERLAMPKLLIMGTNDRYWPLDALNLYWDDLRGPKYALYLPNSGHRLEDRDRAIGSLTGFFRLVASGRPLPRLAWQHGSNGKKLQLSFTADPAPESAVMWVARSATRDFRSVHWEEKPLMGRNGAFTADVELLPEGFAAAFGEVRYRIDGELVYLSTQVYIEPPAADMPVP
ncbi:MAG TPA: PhoPQ-activated protein PqaA family protein [Burkholderiales bacterium]|jgi:PhoPQ-activated pathogenicity-related protein|nr:PhoPQ-activated protein PqaA family protein [Burkholderiales bacterium]